MSKPASLSELNFHVMSINPDLDARPISLVTVVGKDTEGKLRIWIDEHCSYEADHANLEVREALRAMTGRETPFLEAPDFIRDEWLDLDGSWGLAEDRGIEI